METIGRSFFNCSSKSKASKKTHTAYSTVLDCHRTLYPGQDVPKIESAESIHLEKEEGAPKSRGFPSVMKTSLLMAYLQKMIGSNSREASLRAKAAGLLKGLVDAAIATRQFKLMLLHFSLDLENFQWFEQTPTSPTEVCLWDAMFHDQHVQVNWSLDLQAPNKPWVTTSSLAPHMCDFICYALDTPRAVRQDAQQWRLKQCLQRSAYSLLVQLASFWDRQAYQMTKPVSTIHKRRKTTRLPTVYVWHTVARAFESIAAGSDSKLHLSCQHPGTSQNSQP